MWLFGDKIFKEVTEVKWCHKGGTLIWYDWCPYKKRDIRDVHTQKKDHVMTQISWPSTSQGKRCQEESKLTKAWSWTSSLQNCEKINFCLSHPVYVIFQWQPKPSRMDFMGDSHVFANDHVFPFYPVHGVSLPCLPLFPWYAWCAFLWPFDSSWHFCLVSCCPHIDCLNSKLLSSYHDGLGCFQRRYPGEMEKCLLTYGIHFDTRTTMRLPGALFETLKWDMLFHLPYSSPPLPRTLPLKSE